MPRYQIDIPGRGTFEVNSPTPLTDEQAYAAVAQELEKPAASPKEGVLASAQKGIESLISSGRTAFEALAGSPEEAARRGLARSEDIDRRLAESASLERVKKAYEERGLFPAAGEVLRQIPTAIAEQAPNIAATLGSARLGAMAGAPLGPVGVIGGGIAGAALPSLIQQFGSNIQRQAAEQEARGEPIDISRGAAAAAAVPQAALDVAGTFIPLGGRFVTKLTGIPTEALLGRSAAQVQKLADERLLATLAKGTAIGAVAEIPTEIAQQMLERAQAGLSLTSPDALKEYGETAYQVGLLAPIGAAGRVMERGEARTEVAQRQAIERARRATQIEAEDRARQQELAAFRQTPEYLDDIQKRYDALVQQETTLKEALKVKPEGTDPASVEVANRAKKDAQQALRDFKESDEYKATLEEYIQARPLLAGRRQAAARYEETFGKQPVYEPEDLSPAAQAKKLQDQLTALRKKQETLATPAEKQPLENQIYELEQSLTTLTPTQGEYREAQRRLKLGLDTAKQQLANATDTAAMQRHTDTITRVEQALAELEKLGPYVQKPAPTQPSLFELREQVDKAQETGDTEALRRLTPMLAEAEKQPELPFATGYESENILADEIARGREEAAKRRQTVESETEALLRIGSKELSPFAIALKKQRLDEARAALRAAQRAKMGPQLARAKSTGVEYQVLPGGKLSQGTEVATLIRRNEQDWDALSNEIKNNLPRQTDREQLAKDLETKKKQLAEQLDKLTAYGPSPALRLVRAELDSIDQALADIKQKQKIGRRYFESKKVGPLAGRWERPLGYREAQTDTETASDERVADLIERLLPLATELKGAEKEARPLVGEQPALFDVEAQKKIAEKATKTTLPGQVTRQVRYDEEGRKVTDVTAGEQAPRRAVQEAPIESAQRLLEEAQTLDSTIASLNAQIKKAGRPTAPEKVEQLKQLTEQRDELVRQVAAVKSQYNRLADLQTPAYQEATEAPTTADLFAPLEEARGEQQDIQNRLDDLYARRDDLKASLQRRGQLGATPELQALVDQFSKDTPALRDIDAQIENLERELQRVTGKTSARFQEFSEARERERTETETPTLDVLRSELAYFKNLSPQGQAALGAERYQDTLRRLKDQIAKLEAAPAAATKEKTPTLPGFERRAGVRPVDEAQLRALRTELVGLQNVQKDLEKARASADVDPTRYLRQVAIQKQEELDAFLTQSDDPATKEWTPQKLSVLQRRYPKKITPTARDIEYYDGLRKEIKYYSNVVKGRNKRAVENALAENFKKQDALREQIDGLESRQRAYEQQEAVRTGAAPGEAEAQRLIAGEGYRTVTGETRVKPKKLASWGITAVTKTTKPIVAPAKVTATGNLLRQYQRETEAAAQAGAEAAQTLERRANRAAKNITNLSNALAQVYSPAVEKQTEEEITNLMAPGFTPEGRASLRDMAQVYTGLKNSVAGNTTADVIVRLEEEKARLLQEQGRFSAARGDEEKKAKTTYQERITDINNLINDLKRQPKTLDPWVAALTSITKELDAKARTAGEEVGFAQKEYDAEERQRKQAQDKIDALKKKPMTSAFSAQMSNLEYQYDRQLERLQNAAIALSEKNAAYRIARLEQLNFLKAYGQDLKNTINVEAETVKTLKPQIDAQAKANKELQGKLATANQKLAAQRVEEKAQREKPAPTPPYVYTKEERAALERIRQGLGLPGIQYTTDTTSDLVTKTRKAVRDTLALRRAEYDKAVAAGDTAERDRLAPIIRRLESDYESVVQLGERVSTFVGAGAEEREGERFTAAAIAGERLPRRRVGPAVRVGTQPPSQMLTGTEESREAISKGNRPMQAGTVRLTAADMDPQKASAVSLAVLKQQLDAATGERKDQLQAAYDDAINGLSAEQVKAKIKEGNDLIAVPGAATVVAANERVRAAWAAYQKALADQRAAKTPAAKEIAADEVERTDQAWRDAERRLEDARALVAAGIEPNITPKKAVEVAIDDALGVGKLAQTIDEADEGLLGAQRLEKETLPTDAVATLLRMGDVYRAIEQLTADGSTPLIRQSAKDLLEFIENTKVAFNPNLTAKGKPVPAAYNPETNTMLFRPTETTEENIIHEATHAATMRVLSLPDSDLTPRQRNAKKELEAIFGRLKKDTRLSDEYGLEDIKEFVSEVQSNQDFRNQIDQLPWYKRLWNAILRLINKTPPEALSAQVERFIKEIYTPSQRIARAEMVGAAPMSALVGRPASTMDTLRGNLFGLSGRVQFFDRLGAEEEALIRAQNAGALSDYQAFQTQYFMRMADMNSQAAGQFITSGPVRIVGEDVGGIKEYRYESTTGANLINVSDYMEQAAKAGLGTPDEVETMLTVVVAGERANAIPNGWKRLFADDPAAAKAEYDRYQQQLRGNPEAAKYFDAAKAEYKKYNDGLMDFAVQTGFLTPEKAQELKRIPYVPYYRIQNGEVRLFTDRESYIRIGNIKDNPDLQRMVGDNQNILPILTSAVQNTFMLTRMGLHNKATQESADALNKAGFVSAIGKGAGPANINTVHYKVKGENYFAVIDSDQFGVPAALIVKGMEGIKTAVPELVRAMGIPANWVRKFVTRSPAYAIRQLVRDPVNAAIVGGVDGVPVLNALRELGKMRAGLNTEAEELQRGLVVNSNVFTGDERDMEMFLRGIATGRGKWAKLMSEFDKVAMQADAATRTTIYKDSLDKGMSKARAQFRALESQNFSRRGLSPSIQWLNTLVPFFNAQLQGLDVLYRSLRNKMPFAEQLDIRKKLIQRGLMLSAVAMAYALYMQNDDEYKKLPPEVRYSSFLIKLPMFKDYLAIPIPYEVGILFKALPEMMIDMASKDTASKDAVMGLGKLLWQSAPGVMPAAPKPFIEASYGQTQFGPIESAREKTLPAEQRYREATPEVLKMLGGITAVAGVSPLMLEHFVRSYTSTLGLSALRSLDPILRATDEGERPTMTESQMPFIGGLFKSTEGRYLVDRAYERMEEITQAVQGYENLAKSGKLAEAKAFAQNKANLLAAEDIAGAFKQFVGETYTDERAVRADTKLSTAQKDRLIEQIRNARNLEARQFYEATEKLKRRTLAPTS